MNEQRNDVRNLEDLKVLEIEEVQVNEFHPLPDGQGNPTQVHLCMKLKDTDDMLMVLRLKSRRACEELISALQHHTDSVFPEKQDDPNFAKKGSAKT